MTTPDEIDLSALPPALRAAFGAERAARLALEAEVSALAERNRRLDHLVKELRQAIHGRRSEKLTADERQLSFEDLEAAVAEIESAPVGAKPARTATPVAARPNIRRLPEDLPRIEQVIEPQSILCPCGCGEMARIGVDQSERLDIIPARLRVIVTRPRCACRRCRGAVAQAPAPARLIEGEPPTEATLAHALVSKHADHVPMHRQAQILARSGVELDRSTLAAWVGKAAFHLGPIVERMAEELKRGDRLFMDEPPAPVLDPGRGRTKTGYLWVLARDDRRWGGADPPAVVCAYAPGCGTDHAERLVRGFAGVLQVDGYAAYKTVSRGRGADAPLHLAHCWSH